MWSTVLLILSFFLQLSTADDKCCRQPDPRTVDCSGCHLKSVPPLQYQNISNLYLNNNLITEIKDFAFAHLRELRILNIRINRLNHVGNDSFVGLVNLIALDMTQTQRNGYIIPSETFKPLTSLKSLKLGNICVYDRFPFNALAQLPAGLEHLELPVPEGFVFGKEFAHLDHLVTLVLNNRCCSIRYVTRETFAVFSDSLRELQVQGCDVTAVDTDFLKDFHQLEKLNFACNRDLKLQDVLEAVKHLPSSSLTTLVADGVQSGSALVELKSDWFNSSNFENLKRLSLRQTSIIGGEPAFLFHVPKIEFVNMGYNTIVHGAMTNVTKLMTFLGKSNVTSIDISYQGQSYGASSSFRNKYCRRAYRYSDDFFINHPSFITVPDPVPCCNHTLYVGDVDEMLTYNIPQSLLFVYASHINFPGNKVHDIQINADNNILYMDISGVRIKGMYGLIKGFSKLQGVDAGGCGMEHVHPHLLDAFPSLIHLNITRNELRDTQFDRLFQNAGSLRVLDLTSNRLQGIPENIFAGLTSVETVLLSNNPLGEVRLNLDHNINLRSLDLRNTSLLMKPRLMDELDSLQDRINHTLKLGLQGNVFLCDCNNLDLLKWIEETNVEVVDKHTLQCDYGKERRYISEVDMDKLEFSCSDKMHLLTIILTPLASVLVVLVMLVVVHNFRWSLRWRFYLLRRSIHYRRLRQDDATIPLVDNYTTYHAFVSYHHENDHEWVRDILLPRFEDDWGLKLCVGQRNFIAGIPIAENICEAIDKSRYVILVITPSFISSEWCDFEMHMALVKGRRHLVIVYKEEVDATRMSRSLTSLMSSVNYIEYSDTPAGNALFWTRLRDKLTSHVDSIDT